MTKQLEKKITKLVTMKKKSKEQKLLMDMKVYKFYTLKATSSSETKPNSRQSK